MIQHKKTNFIAICLVLCVCLLSSATTSSQVCPGTPGQVVWEGWQGMIGNAISELKSQPRYPHHPTVTQTRYNLSMPVNYDNYLGSRTRGFITVPSTTDVTFNITGDDRVQFYLSTDSDPNNVVLTAYTDAWTNQLEHDKYPEQTSAQITLQAGVDYYFELYHFEWTGSDHATVFWKTDLVSTTDWNIITTTYIKGVDCTGPPCPEVGVACDDGDAATTDDKYDVACNCAGTPSTNNSCVGEAEKITVYRYNDLPGSELNDLYTSTDYPAMPDESIALDLLGIASTSSLNNNGSLIQGFINPPVSGNYRFNITGDNQTIVFISSNDDPANKQAHQALVSGTTSTNEHDKYIWQSTGNIFLQAGSYYYIEVNNKQATGSTHFGVFWQTPYTEAGVWKRIAADYFYDYDCELACIAQGTLCDDGNAFTNNDMYDSNCDCVGTPCSGPDCDSPLANYVPYEECGVTSELDNRADNNWLSCQLSPNPNAAYGDSHWIQYDLGSVHTLLGTHIWNYNEANATNQGMEMVSVDYSIDGNNYTNLGTYTWPLATGDGNYGGFVGPEFMGVQGRYVLITSLDGNVPACRGLGKVSITAVTCPAEGTLCDDGDPDTENDQYDDECNCAGINYLINDCDEEFVTLGDSTLNNEKYSAIRTIQSISTIDDSTKVSFVGGESITLDVGFMTTGQTFFLATIDTCEVNAGPGAAAMMRSLAGKGQQFEDQISPTLEVIPLPGTDEQLIRFYLPKSGDVQLAIADMQGNEITCLVDYDYPQKGLFSKRIRTHKLESGSYIVTMKSDEQPLKERLIVQ